MLLTTRAQFLGVDGIDTDLPSRLELLVLNSVLGKAFFACVSLLFSPLAPLDAPLLMHLLLSPVSSSFQIFFYALRPGFIRYQAPTRWVALNWLVQLSFNALVVKVAGWHSMLYFLLSSHLAGSLHPCAGHFVRRRSDLVLLLESGGRRSGTS